MMRKICVPVAVLAMGIGVAGCKTSDATNVSKKFDQCARNDLFGPKVTRFGASNNVGVGTMYHVRPGGGYDLWFSQQTLTSAPYNMANVVHMQNDAGCSVQSSKSGSMSFSAGLVTAAVKGISADVAAAINDSESLTIEPTTFAIEDLEGGPFLAWAQALPATNAYRANLSKPDYVIMTRAIKVNGLKATITVKRDSSLDVGGKFSPTGKTIASAEAKFNVKRTSDRTVEITSQSPFYIAGELGHFDPNAMAGGQPFQPVGMIDLSKEGSKQAPPQ
jgi:hypothetical protein